MADIKKILSKTVLENTTKVKGQNATISIIGTVRRGQFHRILAKMLVINKALEIYAAAEAKTQEEAAELAGKDLADQAEAKL